MYSVLIRELVRWGLGAGFIFPLFKQLLARFYGLTYVSRLNCMKTNDVYS